MILTTLVASLPSPSTGELSIGPLHLRAYGLMIALGVIAAIWLLGRQLERKRIGTPDDASSIGIWGVAAGIVGARLYHVATDWDRFSDNLTAIPKIWEGGLGIPGGLLLGILAGAWQSKRRGIPPAMLLTCAAPAIPLAQAIGRWGNWFNQELFGKPSDLPWALEISPAKRPEGYAEFATFHPTFLYESIFCLLGGLALLWIDRRLRLKRGQLTALYVILYTFGRFFFENLRIDDAHDVLGLRVNAWVSLGLFLFGVAWFWWLGRHGEEKDAPLYRDAAPSPSA